MMGALTVPAEGLSAEPALAGAKSAGSQPSVRLTAEDVCRTYSAMVCRFAAMAAGSDLDADDLAQDALLKAIRSLDRFDPAKGTIDRWLWRIVANVAKDSYRARARRLAMWRRLAARWHEPVGAVEDRALDCDRERRAHRGGSEFERPRSPADRPPIRRRSRARCRRRRDRVERGFGGAGRAESTGAAPSAVGGVEMAITNADPGPRLVERPVTPPGPRSGANRVLHARRPPAPRARPIVRVARPLAAAIMFVFALWGVFYFAPVAGAALADAPGVGSFSSFVLGEAGLGTGNAATSEDSAASNSGVTIRLIGASANPLRTIVLLRISPATDMPIGMTLKDQFGWSYEERGGYGDLRTGAIAMIFGPRSFVAQPLGMRFAR